MRCQGRACRASAVGGFAVRGQGQLEEAQSVEGVELTLTSSFTSSYCSFDSFGGRSSACSEAARFDITDGGQTRRGDVTRGRGNAGASWADRTDQVAMRAARNSRPQRSTSQTSELAEDNPFSSVNICFVSLWLD